MSHGAWLSAYLVLVSGVSQIVLVLGRLELCGLRRGAGTRAAESLLWNAGNAAVMGGVVAGSAALVTAGSVMLLVALAGFFRAAGVGRRARRAYVLAYQAVVLGLGVSVVVGSAMAGAAPGTWL